MIKTINPYIQIDGGAGRRAVAHYEKALGANVAQVTRFGDVPDMKARPGTEDHLMHAELRVGSNVLMLCDAPAEMGSTPGNTVHIVLQFDDAGEQTKVFDALAAGGQVTLPLQDMYWGDRFGMLADPFGVRWMLTCPLKKD